MNSPYTVVQTNGTVHHIPEAVSATHACKGMKDVLVVLRGKTTSCIFIDGLEDVDFPVCIRCFGKHELGKECLK